MGRERLSAGSGIVGGGGFRVMAVGWVSGGCGTRERRRGGGAVLREDGRTPLPSLLQLPLLPQLHRLLVLLHLHLLSSHILSLPLDPTARLLRRRRGGFVPVRLQLPILPVLGCIVDAGPPSLLDNGRAGRWRWGEEGVDLGPTAYRCRLRVDASTRWRGEEGGREGAGRGGGRRSGGRGSQGGSCVGSRCEVGRRGHLNLRHRHLRRRDVEEVANGHPLGRGEKGERGEGGEGWREGGGGSGDGHGEGGVSGCEGVGEVWR